MSNQLPDRTGLITQIHEVLHDARLRNTAGLRNTGMTRQTANRR